MLPSDQLFSCGAGIPYLSRSPREKGHEAQSARARWIAICGSVIEQAPESRRATGVPELAQGGGGVSGLRRNWSSASVRIRTVARSFPRAGHHSIRRPTHRLCLSPFLLPLLAD
jgi:hypothetical protein